MRIRFRTVSSQAMSPLIATLKMMLPLLIFSTAASDELIGTFAAPSNASGLAFDGRVLWVGGIGASGEWIRAVNPECGLIVDSIRAPVPDCLGLTWHNGGLVYTTMRSDTTYFVNRDGFAPLFPNPVPYMAGMASENGYFWASTYFGQSGVVLKLDDNGRIVNSLPFRGRHSRDMAFHKGRLFIADRLAQEVRMVSPETGRFVRTFRTPGVNPDGITSSGDYLWVLDDGDAKSGDRLYQYWISPDGNIRFSRLYYNFGSVVVNDTRTWVLWIYNDGARDARLSSFESRDGNDDIIVPHVWNFPQVIEPGDSVGLRISFQPAYPDSVHINFVFVYDIDRQEYIVDVRGKGVNQRRDLRVSERQLDFGMARYGEHLQSSNIRWLDLENNGGEPLTIQDIRFNDPSFRYGFYDFPVVFREPGLYRVPIFFEPNRAGNFNAGLTIFSDDPDNREVQISLVGQSRLNNYTGGEVLWHMVVGDRNGAFPQVRAIQDIDDVTGDGLADVIVATNDYKVSAFHAATTDLATAVWSYGTNVNPWRSGLVMGQEGLSEGDDWDGDGVHDVAFGLSAGAQTVIALSGRLGREIWMFDTHGLRDGGGNVRVVNARADFTSDQIRDVFAVCAYADDQHSTNAVMLLEGREGELLWLHPLDWPPVNAVSIPDVTGDDIQDLVIFSADGSVQAVDGEGGNEIWDADLEVRIIASFALNDVNRDGSVDVGIVTQMDGIICLNGSNGVQLWRTRNIDRLVAGTSPGDLNRNGSYDIIFTDEFNFIRSVDGRTATAVWDTTIYTGSIGTSVSGFGDLNGDGVSDFIVGTEVGRMFAISGTGQSVLWSYSNVGEGHTFNLVHASRDIDGNGESDAFASMENGMLFCMAGSYIGRQSVDDPNRNELMPELLTVKPAFPNPFNSVTVLPVKLRQRAEVNWIIYSVLGQEVARAQFGVLPAGEHRLVWNGTGNGGAVIPSGIYFIEINAAGERSVIQAELLR